MQGDGAVTTSSISSAVGGRVSRGSVVSAMPSVAVAGSDGLGRGGIVVDCE